MNVVILQPSYVPWRGYFHQIQKADIFVFYDCVQYDKHGWRNRNIIKTPQGDQWITVPVSTKGSVSGRTPIHEIPIIWNTTWTEKHVRALQMNYAKAPFFKRYKPLLEEIFSRHDKMLSDFTCASTERLARELGIKHTQFMRSSTLPAEGTKTDRLLSILKHLGATHYISGPSARDYMEQEKFIAAGISVEYMTYDYPEYPQLHGGFLPNVTVLDLLFNVGEDASQFIWQ